MLEFQKKRKQIQIENDILKQAALSMERR